MTDEKQMEYRALVDSSMLNSRRDIQISGLLRIIETTLEEHLLDIGMDNPRLVREENVSWAFLSLTAEVFGPIEPGEVLTGRTWFSGRRGPLFRRELEYRHMGGERAAAMSCFSGLIDLGACGIGDRWRDIALCYRSLRWNAEGAYGGKVYPDVKSQMLFDALGIGPDLEKIRYYILMDELF